MSKENSYDELLKDPRWLLKRQEILERDNFTCTNCKHKYDSYDIHHLSYEYGKKPWEYPNKNLVTLCENCHKLQHMHLDHNYDFIENRKKRKNDDPVHISSVLKSILPDLEKLVIK